jgi:hypothetical protein
MSPGRPTRLILFEHTYWVACFTETAMSTEVKTSAYPPAGVDYSATFGRFQFRSRISRVVRRRQSAQAFRTQRLQYHHHTSVDRGGHPLQQCHDAFRQLRMTRWKLRSLLSAKLGASTLVLVAIALAAATSILPAAAALVHREPAASTVSASEAPADPGSVGVRLVDIPVNRK